MSLIPNLVLYLQQFSNILLFYGIRDTPLQPLCECYRLKFYHVYIYIYKICIGDFFFGLVVSFLSLTDENFVPWTVEIYKSYRMLMMYMGLVEMVSTGWWGGLHLTCAINGNSRNHQNANQTSPTTGRVLLVLYICNKIQTSIFSSTI